MFDYLCIDFTSHFRPADLAELMLEGYRNTKGLRMRRVGAEVREWLLCIRASIDKVRSVRSLRVAFLMDSGSLDQPRLARVTVVGQCGPPCRYSQ